MRALVFNHQKLVYMPDHSRPARAEDEALIRITHAGICDTDLQIMAGYMNFCGILGHEFTGEVIESADTSWLGKRVVGEINLGCGHCPRCLRGEKEHCPARSVLGILNKDGVFADYCTLPIVNLKPVPPEVSPLQAVFCEPLAAALEILEFTHVKPTHRVLVIGDGKLGNLIAQVLALTGCDLTILGRHQEKLDLIAHSNPAVTVVLYNDREKHVSDLPHWDIVIEATGRPDGLNLAMNLVRPRGQIVMKSTVADRSMLDLNLAVIHEIQLSGSRCGPFEAALRLLQAGRIEVEPLIEEIMPISDGIEAMKKAAGKGSRKIILTMMD